MWNTLISLDSHSLSLYGQQRHSAINNFSCKKKGHISFKIHDDEYVFLFLMNYCFKTSECRVCVAGAAAGRLVYDGNG